MNAPIAEVPPPAPRRASQKPPIALTVAVMIGLVLGALDVLLMIILPVRQIPEIGKVWEDVLTFVAMGLLHFLPLLLVWRGGNWARWLMIALSALGLVMYLTPVDMVALPPLRQLVNQVYAPYYLILIIFLLTPRMRQHFTGKPTGARSA